MSFLIQVGNPEILSVARGATVRTLAEALPEIFAESTETALLRWNGILVSVDYHQDLSEMIDDVVDLLSSLVSQTQGACKVVIGSQSLHAEWQVHWKDGDVRIQSKWTSAAGRIEEFLNQRSELTVKIQEFLPEWKSLLRKVIQVLDSSGIRIEQEAQLTRLRKLETSLTGAGMLYASSKSDPKKHPRTE